MSKYLLHRCVITPNRHRIKRRSVTLTIPAGTQIIEAFKIVDGKKVVTETLIAGIGTIKGPLL